MARVCRIGVEAIFGGVTAVKHVSEGKRRRFSAVEWSGSEVEHGVKRDEGVEGGEHGVDFGGVGVVFDFEEDNVFDGCC